MNAHKTSSCDPAVRHSAPRASRPATSLRPPDCRHSVRSALQRLRRAALLPLLVATLTWLSPAAADADGLRLRLDCPDAVAATTAPLLNVEIENRGCSPRNVRILSTIVGNGADSVGGMSVIGPEIAASDVMVPAATDQLSGLCVGNSCDGASIFCQSDADCTCVQVLPTRVDIPVTGPTPIPVEFTDSFVEQFAFADSDLDSTPIGSSCLIEVPEPGLESMVWPLFLLATFALRRPLRTRTAP